MRNLFFAAAAALLLTACGNSSNDNTDTVADTAVTQYQGVENVNGNIPDTAATGAEPSTNYHSDSTD